MNEHVKSDDEKTVEEWLQQEPPAAEDLTEDDVWAAWLAHDVLHSYRIRGPFSRMDFDFGHTMMAMEAGSNPWPVVLETVKRGIAVLNGYLLVANSRVPNWTPAPVHKAAIVSRMFGAGYTAMQEYHRTYSLVPVTDDDLITITAAAEILYKSNTQYHRIKVTEDIQDGFLQRFIAKDENNPQKSTRVSKREVRALLREREG